MNEKKRFCKRCLLKEFDEEEYLKILDKYIKKIDKNEKTDDKLYEKRLSSCKECNMLIKGTCTACGCFVELRAAVKKSRCPYKYW